MVSSIQWAIEPDSLIFVRKKPGELKEAQLPIRAWRAGWAGFGRRTAATDPAMVQVNTSVIVAWLDRRMKTWGLKPSRRGGALAEDRGRVYAPPCRERCNPHP